MMCLLAKPNGEFETVEADLCSPSLAVIATPPLEALAFSFNDVVTGQIIGDVFCARKLAKKSRWGTFRLYGGDPSNAQFATFIDDLERAGLIVASNRHGAIAVSFEPESEHLAQKALARAPWRPNDEMANVA